MQILQTAVLKQICVAICMGIVTAMMSALLDSLVEAVMIKPISLQELNVVQYLRVKTVLHPRSTSAKDIATKTGSALAILYVVIILIVMKALIIPLGQNVVNKVTLFTYHYSTHTF